MIIVVDGYSATVLDTVVFFYELQQKSCMMPVEWEKSVKRELLEESNAVGGSNQLLTESLLTYLNIILAGDERR
jgi:hypothetical protein